MVRSSFEKNSISSPHFSQKEKKRKERKTNKSIRQENLKTRFQKTFLNSVLNSKVYQRKKKEKLRILKISRFEKRFLFFHDFQNFPRVEKNGLSYDEFTFKRVRVVSLMQSTQTTHSGSKDGKKIILFSDFELEDIYRT